MQFEFLLPKRHKTSAASLDGQKFHLARHNKWQFTDEVQILTNNSVTCLRNISSCNQPQGMANASLLKSST